MRIGKELHEACAVFGVSTLGDEGAGMVYNGLLSCSIVAGGCGNRCSHG